MESPMPGLARGPFPGARARRPTGNLEFLGLGRIPFGRTWFPLDCRFAFPWFSLDFSRPNRDFSMGYGLSSARIVFMGPFPESQSLRICQISRPLAVFEGREGLDLWRS
jgi:hypothetical protein